MVDNKSLDLYKQVIAALLSDVQTTHSNVFSPRAYRLTIAKIESRTAREGIGFLTKTLPRLAKAFDKALTEKSTFDSTQHRFKTMPGSELPRFLGEFFARIFTHGGRILPTPCVKSIKVIRQVLYLFYKLELPYTPEDENTVIQKFVRTEDEVQRWNNHWKHFPFDCPHQTEAAKPFLAWQTKVVHTAQTLLYRLFESFDVRDIHPRHGPGVVSTKEALWTKYQWTNVSERIARTYPIDEYFFVSQSHVCDRLDRLTSLTGNDSPAQVILVPKDSRGPRLISCEPVDFQWVQQGLSRAMVQHVESHFLTKGLVNFTNQGPNRRAALFGSSNGRYATLDLNEASDRVSLELVRLLFPEPLVTALMNCRSSATRLPNGEVLTLGKYAPMGSALCFPVLALTTWALLSSAAYHAYPNSLQGTTSSDAEYVLDRILVYGDDVIVPSAFAAHAMTTLESFGLKVNADKSCTSGFFRESCGMDAYQGIDVTPVRFRTVWSSSQCPSAFASYIAYANEMHRRGFINSYDLIVRHLNHIYGWIPTEDMRLACPSLVDGTPQTARVRRHRANQALQKLEYLVYDIEPRKVRKKIDGWLMLLRFFAEKASVSPSALPHTRRSDLRPDPIGSSFDARLYTERKTTKLVLRWR